MKTILLLLSLPGLVLAQCAVSITSPSNGATVSGYATMTAQVTTCPSAVRVEFLQDGRRPYGDGTQFQNFAVVGSCSTSCSGSMTGYTGAGYDFAYNADTNTAITATVYNSAGTLLATSPAITVNVRHWLMGTMALNGTPTNCTLSGGAYIDCHDTLTIPISVNFNNTNPLISSSVIGYGEIRVLLDGYQVFDGQNSFVNTTVTLDSTKWANSRHHLHASLTTWKADSSAHAVMPVLQFDTDLTFNNSAATTGVKPRELLVGHSMVDLWCGSPGCTGAGGGIGSATLTPTIMRTDGTTAATTASYSSDATGIAIVDSSGLISSIASASTGGIGIAHITATDLGGSGLSRTITVYVHPGTPIAPHFSLDGQFRTAFQAGQSILSVSGLLSDQNGWYNPGVGDPNLSGFAQVAMGINIAEWNSIFSPDPTNANCGPYPTFEFWKQFCQEYYQGYINTAVPKYGFQGVMGNIATMIVGGWTLQASRDNSVTVPVSDKPCVSSPTCGLQYRINEVENSVAGLHVIGAEVGDEVAYGIYYPPGGGVIGATNGPVSFTVTGGTSVSVNWPSFPPPLSMGFSGTVEGASNPCLNQTGINLTAPITYTASCALTNGTYSTSGHPVGGGVNETTATVNFFNGLCPGQPKCQTYPPLNLASPNTAIVDIHDALQAGPHPFGYGIPLQGNDAAWRYGQATGVHDGRTVSDYASLYWTRGGASINTLPWSEPSTFAVYQDINAMETRYEIAAPYIDPTRPFLMLAQAHTGWYYMGGVPYTGGTVSGNTFTLTGIAPQAVVGGQIRVSGSTNCDGPYDIGTVTTSGGGTQTQFTVTQSVSCSGSAGTIQISTAPGYYEPANQDMIKQGGNNGNTIAAQMWTCVGLGCGGTRLYGWGISSIASVKFYPHDATTAYMDVFDSGNENGQLGIDYQNNAPFQKEIQTGVTLSAKLMHRLEPDLIQPVCTPPDLGSHIHTYAKCGSRSKVIIAIDELETSNQITLTFGSFATGNPATRYRIVNGSEIRVDQINSATDSFSTVPNGNEIIVWVIPVSASTSPSSLVTLTFNPSSAGGTQTAFHWNPTTTAINWPTAKTVFGSSTTIALDLGLPINYTTQYLDVSNVPVGAESAIQTLTCPSGASGTLVSCTIASGAFITPASLGPWTNTQNINNALTGSGFSGAITWSVVSGALCNGLTIGSSTGIITGNIGASGTCNFTIQATDGTTTVQQPYSVTVNTAPSVTTASPLPNGTQGVAYSTTIATTGGTQNPGPNTCVLGSGSVTGGLTLNTNCTISGTPGVSGALLFKVIPVDSNNVQGTSVPLSLTINSSGPVGGSQTGGKVVMGGKATRF